VSIQRAGPRRAVGDKHVNVESDQFTGKRAEPIVFSRRVVSEASQGAARLNRSCLPRACRVSLPESYRGSMDCFVAYAPRNDGSYPVAFAHG